MKLIRSLRLLMSFAGIAVIMSGCDLSANPAALTAIPVGTKLPFYSTPTVTLVTPSMIPTSTLLPTQTPQVVVITAMKGNIFIRRGPDLAYNPVSVLMDGQTASALARDVLSNWVQIPVPAHPNETGWISIQTHFVQVSGDVTKLPEVVPTDWPLAASLRNCTYHQMEVDPVGIVIPAADSFPENTVSINPGIYTIHDVEVDGNPEVMEVEIKEGSQIEIREDGAGNHKKCVEP